MFAPYVQAVYRHVADMAVGESIRVDVRRAALHYLSVLSVRFVDQPYSSVSLPAGPWSQSSTCTLPSLDWQWMLLCSIPCRGSKASQALMASLETLTAQLLKSTQQHPISATMAKVWSINSFDAVTHFLLTAGFVSAACSLQFSKSYW